MSERLTTLYLRCEEAIDPVGEPALAVCRCSDGSWIAWWGVRPAEGWSRATDLRYPNGGGFWPPHQLGSLIDILGQTWRISSIECRQFEHLRGEQQAIADPDSELKRRDWLWVFHAEAQ